MNDAGKHLVYKKESVDAYLDFLGVPRDSSRRNRGGLWHSRVLGSGDRQLKLILLDTRCHGECGR